MQLLERFSANLKDVLVRSIHLATELHHATVDPVHLFFSLSNQKGAVAGEILKRFKIEAATVEQALLAIPSTPSGTHEFENGALQKLLTPLSSASKLALEKAMAIAQEGQHNYIGTEHLLAALLRLDDGVIMHILAESNADPDEMVKQLQTVLANAGQLPKISEAAQMMERIEEQVQDQVLEPEELEGMPLPEAAGMPRRRNGAALDFFATNLTSPEAQKNIDPVIGREKEIERVIQVLCRRTKNNPLLLGDPGVGKTAIVEGLAKRIVEGDVPDLLLNKKIYSLDMGLMIAGTIYRGEFEARLRQVIDEAAKNANIILFIDEVHNIVGAGSNQGTMDAANILKPALARGQIRCIGATTPGEFKKFIENDAALERRFQPVYTKEPTLEASIAILEGVKDNYENYHRITITDDAITAAVRLSDRYITNKFLPDKAIDLIDETAAAKRLHLKGPAAQNRLARLERALEKVLVAKETAATTDQFEKAVELKQDEAKLRAEIKKANEQLKHNKSKPLGTITARDIAEQVAKITGTPPSEIILDDKKSLLDLEARLKQYVVGQDTVIGEVAESIRQARLGLSNPDRPLASLLFVGESGVGKTELAKTLAKILYANPDALVKLDMSEFNESFGVSKLLGSPAGYIGYKESNQFTDRIKMNPHCVILLDEIDKAHKDVVKLLLQMLENGEVTDSTGKKISLRHAIIILTTSYGADTIKKGTIGFGTSEQHSTNVRAYLLERLKEYFSPEVINRLDQVCIFEPLNQEKLVKIAALELERFNERLTNYHTSVTSTNKVLEWIVAQLPNKQLGAREVRRELRNQVERLLAHIILEKTIKDSYTLTVHQNKLAVK